MSELRTKTIEELENLKERFWFIWNIKITILQYTVCLFRGHKKDPDYPGTYEIIYGIKMFCDKGSCRRCWSKIRD